jgi:hypothetical protein
VVVPCRLAGAEIGYELRHYCDQLRLARRRAGIACDGGSDFYAKLVAVPQLRMGTLHDGEELVAAAILAPSASASAAGSEEAAAWLALPRLSPAALVHGKPAAGKPLDSQRLTFERTGAVTFELRHAAHGGVVAPSVEQTLHAQFFIAAPSVH